MEGIRNMYFLSIRMPGFRVRDPESYQPVGVAVEKLYRIFRSRTVLRNEFLQKLVDQIDKSVDVVQKSSKTGYRISWSNSLKFSQIISCN
jgi:hypothetical protein